MGGSHYRLWTEGFIGLDFLDMFSIGGAGEGRHLRWLLHFWEPKHCYARVQTLWIDGRNSMPFATKSKHLYCQVPLLFYQLCRSTIRCPQIEHAPIANVTREIT
jgi:hypothetical protein